MDQMKGITQLILLKVTGKATADQESELAAAIERNPGIQNLVNDMSLLLNGTVIKSLVKYHSYDAEKAINRIKSAGSGV